MSEPQCIDLLTMFGAKYKIGWDECYDHKGRPKENLDPWYMTIPCERGIITPYGDTRLSLLVDSRPITANRLVESGICQLVQDGDHEKTFLFDVSDFDQIAAIVNPRKRRQVSEEERQRLATMGVQTRFQSRRTERSQRAPTHSEASA